MSKKGFGYLEFGLGLGVGLGLGLSAGLLFAPQSGSATREEITSRAREFKDSAAEMLERAQKSLQVAYPTIERALGLKGLAEKGLRRKLEEIRAELEKQLKTSQTS